MVFGVIDRKSKRYYTYLKDVFSAIIGRQIDYNWLITDTEIIAQSEELDSQIRVSIGSMKMENSLRFLRGNTIFCLAKN